MADVAGPAGRLSQYARCLEKILWREEIGETNAASDAAASAGRYRKAHDASVMVFKNVKRNLWQLDICGRHQFC